MTVAIWGTLVLLFFLWQATQYRGIVSFLAEWEFDRLGSYYPIVSYIALVCLFGFPVFLFIRGRSWARNAREAADERQATIALAGEVRRFARAMFVLSFGFATAAVGVVLLTLLLPSPAGPVQVIDASTSPDTIREGPTALRGTVDLSRIAAITNDVWVTRLETSYAPVIDRPGSRNVTFFVQTDAGERWTQTEIGSGRRGILQRNGLPGELASLYRYAGYDVAVPNYVLYASRRTMTWGYRVVAVELAIVAFVLLLLGVWQTIVWKRIARYEVSAPDHDAAMQPENTLSRLP